MIYKWVLPGAFWPLTHILFLSHARTHSWESIVHCCNILHLILSFFHCAFSRHFVCNTNSEVVNTNPKLRLQNDVGTKLPYLKCRKKQKFRIEMRYLCGYLLGLQKVHLKHGESTKFINLKLWLYCSCKWHSVITQETTLCIC